MASTEKRGCGVAPKLHMRPRARRRRTGTRGSSKQNVVWCSNFVPALSQRKAVECHRWWCLHQPHHVLNNTVPLHIRSPGTGSYFIGFGYLLLG
eukprot:scaffold84554_cov59-Phaeocystis_antarctica.AAC.2